MFAKLSTCGVCQRCGFTKQNGDCVRIRRHPYTAGFFRDITADARLATVWESLAKKQHPCFNVDDMLLSKLFQRFKYNVEGTGLNPFTDVMDRALTDEHPDWFELCKHTSRNCDSMRCLNEILP